MSSDLFKRATDPDQYDAIDWSGEASPNSSQRLWIWEFLSQFADLWKGKDVLEIGSGTGWFVEKIKQDNVNSIVGIEPSERNYKLAKERNPDIELLKVSLDDFSTDKKFDTIVMIYVISHLEDLDKDFKKIHNLLKPGGYFINLIPDYDYCRTPRGPLDLQIHELNENECVIVSQREEGEMVDVIRTTDFSIQKHLDAGFKLVDHIEMKPTEVLKKARKRFSEFENTTLAHLLIFRK